MDIGEGLYMKYPPKVYEIASKAPLFNFSTKTSWATIQNKSAGDALYYIHRDAANKIAHEFVCNIGEHMTMYSSSEPDAYTIRFSSVALRYDELMELLYTAYREGQTDGMRHSFNPNFLE